MIVAILSGIVGLLTFIVLGAAMLAIEAMARVAHQPKPTPTRERRIPADNLHVVPVAALVPPPNPAVEEAVEGLVSLGYSKREARASVNAIPHASVSTEEIVRAVLRQEEEGHGTGSS